jgi:hypothetical protein
MRSDKYPDWYIFIYLFIYLLQNGSYIFVYNHCPQVCVCLYSTHFCYTYAVQCLRSAISCKHFKIVPLIMCGPGNSVGIATDYGLDGPGIESRWGRDFPPVQTGSGAHPASCTMGPGSFPGGGGVLKCVRGVLLTTHPLLAPRAWTIRAILNPPLGPNRACNGVTLPLPFYLQ